MILAGSILELMILEPPQDFLSDGVCVSVSGSGSQSLLTANGPEATILGIGSRSRSTAMSPGSVLSGSSAVSSVAGEQCK